MLQIHNATVGGMHLLYTFLFNSIVMFDLDMERARLKASHHTLILRLISSSMKGVVKTCWSR